MPKDKEEYYSESLFQDADLPCRIVICFVETSSKNGTQTSNPFSFQRSWKVETKRDDIFFVDETNSSHLEKRMDERFSQFESRIISLLGSTRGRGKGKGRGKRSNPNQDYPEQSTSAEATERLNQFVESVRSLSSGKGTTRSLRRKDVDIESSLFTEDLDDPVKVTKTIYIKKIDCQLNTNSLDQVEDKANQDECIQMYWRMFKFNGQLNSLFSNGISYDDFRNGYFFAVYDLSTSGKCGTNFVVPSIRVGMLSILKQISKSCISYMLYNYK